MSEINGKQLPSGWAEASLSEFSTILLGQSPPSSTYNSSGKGLPFFQGKAEFNDLYPEMKVWCSHPKKIAEKDDVLLSVRAPVGPTNLAPARCCIGRGLAAVRPESGINLKYLLHLFRRFSGDLDSKGTGTTFKAVSGKIVRDFVLPVAPTREQQCIAEALDELLSDLDAGVAALERVREKLKLYRASVLKAAVEGTLTADWREQHPYTEPASTLLQRILTERLRSWEAEQIRKFKEKGKEPPKNWKAKYREPVDPDTTNLSPLSEGWCWATMDMVIVEGPQNGLYLPATSYGSGYSILRIDDFQNGWLRPREDLNKVNAEVSLVTTYSLRHGDLVINRVNSMTHLGKCLIVDKQLDGALFESNMMRAQLSASIEVKFVELYLHSLDGRTRLTKDAKWAVNQASINQQDIKRTAIPLPPQAEQQAIVEASETQISMIDHLETELDTKLKSAQALRQAILHQAFTGKLVSQDPKDEPASELLKRIAAEREARAHEAAAAKRTQKKTQGPPRTPRQRRSKKNQTKDS